MKMVIDTLTISMELTKNVDTNVQLKNSDRTS